MDEDACKRLTALLHLFTAHGLDELVVERAGFKVRLRATRADAQAAAPIRSPRPATSGAPAAPQRRSRTVAVRSPLIGVCYRSPSPEAPPFVAVGDLVEEGQTVCIVEAMKVFNEIRAEWRGRVVAIPAENGRLVQAGDPLVVLEFVQD